MKRYLILLMLFLFSAFSSQAAPRWLTAAPRTIGRAYGNMLTFKNKPLAVEQWATLGVMIFDDKTTLDVFHRCYNCVESTWYHINHGRQYGIGVAAIDVAIGTTEYVSIEQYGQEIMKNKPNKYWRALGYTVVSIPLKVHLQAGINNMRIPASVPGSDSGILKKQ